MFQTTNQNPIIHSVSWLYREIPASYQLVQDFATVTHGIHGQSMWVRCKVPVIY